VKENRGIRLPSISDKSKCYQNVSANFKLSGAWYDCVHRMVKWPVTSWKCYQSTWSYSVYNVNNNDVCINIVHVKFEVLTVLTMKMTDCLDGSPCSLIET